MAALIGQNFNVGPWEMKKKLKIQILKTFLNP